MYVIETIIVPVDYTTIRLAHANNNKLQYLIGADTDDSRFKIKSYRRVSMTVKLGKDKRWRIFILAVLQQQLIALYHEHLMHIGALRMYKNLYKVHTWSKMMHEINAYAATCDTCQRFKSTDNPHAEKLLLSDSHSVELFEVLAVDLCGPWKMHAKVQTEERDKDKTVILDKIIRIIFF